MEPLEIEGDPLLFLIKSSKTIRDLAGNADTITLEPSFFVSRAEYNFIKTIAAEFPVAKAVAEKVYFNKGFTDANILEIMTHLQVDKKEFVSGIKESYTERPPISRSKQRGQKDTIHLRKNALLYWITHSKLIEAFAEGRGITKENALDSVLEINKSDFEPISEEGDWRLLSDLLRGNIIATHYRTTRRHAEMDEYANSIYNKYQYIFESDYSSEQLERILHYLHFMTPSTMMAEIHRRFTHAEKSSVKPAASAAMPLNESTLNRHIKEVEKRSPNNNASNAGNASNKKTRKSKRSHVVPLAHREGYNNTNDRRQGSRNARLNLQSDNRSL